MARISYLTRIEFGVGEFERLPEYLSELGISKPLICTDEGLVSVGWGTKINALIPKSVIFDATPANPTESAVMAAVEKYFNGGCDGIIGFGGGSSIDLAKGVRILTGHEPSLEQYAAINGGLSKIHGSIAPMVAVPTTAGTGSEVGRAAVINMNSGRKLGVLSPFIMPTLAICDPALTYGLPKGLTAATGMDAISHCLETFMAPAFNPPAEAIALHGLALGFKAITKAVDDGSNLVARRDMMVCALEGAMAFQKGLGAIHSLTHPLGSITDLNLHHGTLNAILAPAVLRFNRESIGVKRHTLAQIMGGDPDRIMAELNSKIGIPPGLVALGVNKEMMERVASDALMDHCHSTNPRIATRDQYLQILNESA